MTIQTTAFHASTSGQHLVVFGAIHGNEYCGVEAIHQAIDAFQQGIITLKRGKITFVPIANPKAYAQKQRFIDRNLNRHFYPPEQCTTYEDTLTPILCSLLDEADALLDIHSYQSEGGAFCFLGTSSQAEIDYARALGVPHYISGWADAFNNPQATQEQRNASIGTTDYTRNTSRKGIAVTLECGNHDNADNVRIGYHAIMRALQHLDMAEISRNMLPKVDTSHQQCITMQQIYYKERSGQLSKAWTHLEAVQKGEVIAQYDDDGTHITAPEDGVIVLPKTSTDHGIGSEWFYFGIKTDFPKAP